MKNIIFIILFLSCENTFAQELQAIGKAAHDGDSYKLEITKWSPEADEVTTTEWVRLEACDCPEVLWPGHITKDQPFGVEAGAYGRALVKGENLTIETFGRDKYLRLLVTITLPDGRDLAEVLIGQGYCNYMRNDLDEKTRRHLQYVRNKAKKGKLKIWGDTNRVGGDEWRKTHKS